MSEIAIANTTVQDVERGVNDGVGVMYSSIPGDTHEARIANLEVVSNSVKLEDHIGDVLNISNIVLQSVELTDENTGEVNWAVRTVLVDSTGKSYHAVSKGVLLSVKNILGFLGEPKYWDAPLPVRPKKGGTGLNKYTTLDINPTKK